MPRYREAFSWSGTVDDFVRFTATERPMLHVCSGRSDFGDTTLDKYEPADVAADWTALPFERDAYEAMFADPPWNAAYKPQVAAFMREALRVAPVAYLMAPWVYCAEWAPITRLWWREFPGVNAPVLLSRYERAPTQLALVS